MKNFHKRAGVWVILAFCLIHSPTLEAKEGFGLAKKSANLTRTTPPAVFLMGTRIAVQASAVSGGDSDLCQRLQRQLESVLLGRDSRLSSDAVNPQTLVDVNLLQNETSERWENREETRAKQVGTKDNGKPIYAPQKVNVRYKVVSHSFGVAFKVTDQIKAVSLDADSITIPFEEAFREGNEAPAGFALENRAIEAAVEHIARRITPTREQIGVLLPKGRLEDLAGLASAGLWSRYLDSVEAMTASPKPDDEAYRQYALGTSYEALGYAADEPETTLKYLEKAHSYYNEAIVAKPDEKFFSQPYDSFFTDKTAAAPLERVQSALVGYRRIKDFQDNYDAMVASLPPAGAKNMPEAAPAAAGKMDNAAIIRMVKAGLPEEIVLTAIDGASENAFDISPNGLIQLSQGQVSGKIIARLQKVNGTKKPEAAKKTTSTSKQ